MPRGWPNSPTTSARRGCERINVSLDTLDRATFARLARRDSLPQVLEGIAAAKAAGLKVKINTVALKGINEAEIPDLIAWAHGQGFELTLIEVMPLGEVEEDRFDHYLPLSAVREALEQRWTLTPDDHRSGGPARYVDCGGNRRAAGLHHAADQQFLRRLQPHPRHRHRPALCLPWRQRAGRSARGAALGQSRTRR